MSLAPGQTVRLADTEFAIIESLGAGRVADVYLVSAVGHTMVLKLLRSDRSLDGADAAGLRNEAPVLARLNEAETAGFSRLTGVAARAQRASETAAQRLIVAQLAAGEDETGRPYVVQELAPPGIAIEPVKGLEDEQRILQVMARVAQALQLAHRNGIAFEDFKPPTKADRIRVNWREGERMPEVRIIDWNITGGATSFAQDLFYFGGHLYLFLLGSELYLEDGRPPHNLGVGVQGWANLSQASRGLLGRLLNRDESRRYASAADLVDDLNWLVGVLGFSQSPGRLRELAFAALGQKRADRVLAASDLALRCPLSAEDERTFRNFQEQARTELDKEMRRALRMIEISLSTGQYPQAIKEAERELTHLDKRSNLAHRVRYLSLQAQLGMELRAAGKKDPRGTEEWQAVEAGIQRLAEFDWAAAEQQFELIARRDPDWAKLPAFVELLNQARAGAPWNTSSQLRQQAAPTGSDYLRSWQEWQGIEQEKVRLLDQAVEKITQAVMLAPKEPLLYDALQAVKREHGSRQDRLPQLRDAKRAWEQARYAEAETILGQVLAQDSQNPYALALWESVQRKSRFQAARNQGLSDLGLFRYDEALKSLREAASLADDDSEVARALQAAVLGAAVHQRFRDAIERSHSLLSNDDLAAAQAEKTWAADLDNTSFETLKPRLNLTDVPADLAPYETFRLGAEDASRLSGVTVLIGQRKDAILKAALEQSELLWSELRFVQAIGEIDQAADRLKGFLDERELQRIDRQRANFSRCLELTTEVQAQLDAQVSQVALKPSAPDDLLADMRRALKPVAEDSSVPPALKAGVSALVATLDQPVARIDQEAARQLPQLDWPPMSTLGALLDVVFATEKEWAAKRIEAQRTLLAVGTSLNAPGQIEAEHAANLQSGLIEALQHLALNDGSKEARQMRKATAEHWRSIVHRIADFTVAAQAAKQGEAIFLNLRLDARLRNDRELLELAQQVESQVDRLLQAVKPNGERGDMPALLDNVDEGLSRLVESTKDLDWPLLDSRTENQRTRVTKALSSLVDESLPVAGQPHDRAYYEAVRSQSDLVKLLREKPSWTEGFSGQFHELENAAERASAMLALYRQIEELQNAIASETQSLGSPAVRSAIGHIRTGVGEVRLGMGDEFPQDIEASLEVLDLAQTKAKKAQASRLSDVRSSYLPALRDLIEELDVKPAVPADPASLKLMSKAEKEIEQAVNYLARSLGEALAQEARDWYGRDDPNTKTVKGLYWQARLVLGQLFARPPLPRWSDATGVLRESLDLASSNMLSTIKNNPQVHAWLDAALDGDELARRRLEKIIESLVLWLDEVAKPPPKTMPPDRFEVKLPDMRKLRELQNALPALNSKASTGDLDDLAERLDRTEFVLDFFLT